MFVEVVLGYRSPFPSLEDEWRMDGDGWKEQGVLWPAFSLGVTRSVDVPAP